MVSLKSTKQKFYNRSMRAFDIETYGDDNVFIVCSMFGFIKDNCNRINPYMRFHFRPKGVHDEMKLHINHNSDWFATFLSFDFHGSFFKSKEMQHFYTRFNGSQLQVCKTYVKDGKFYYSNPNKSGNVSRLQFEDTLNHTHTSVRKLGKMLGLPKGKKPAFLGKRRPETEDEWRDFLRYNMLDSIITYLFMQNLIECYEQLGATKKTTIAATAMSCFKNRFLKDEYHVMPTKLILKILEGYIGGRNEVDGRGCVKGLNFKMLDVKSMYPFHMAKLPLPNPNHYGTTTIQPRCIRYIRGNEGMSKVDIIMPKKKYCLLPVKSNTPGLKFKYGKIHGTFTHIMLRKAVAEGGIITKIHHTIYFDAVIDGLLSEYVMTLYTLKESYKKEGNKIMSHCCKILLNSLYGKFAQKFLHRAETYHENQVTLKMRRENLCVQIGNTEFIRVYEDSEPAAFSQAIWSAYITDAAKIHLYDLMVAYDSKYCDTDCIVTDQMPLEIGIRLGDLELVMHIVDGFIVRSKLYCFKGTLDGKTVYKCAAKGIQIPASIFAGLDEDAEDFEQRCERATYEYMYDMIKNHRRFDADVDDEVVDFHFERLLKFNEALIRGRLPNSIVRGEKKVSMNDTKRLWKKKFSVDSFDEQSEPIENEIMDGVNYDKSGKDRADSRRSDRRIPTEIRKRRLEEVPKINEQ
jgi:hypothetical protein